MKRVPILLAPLLGGWLMVSLGLANGMQVGLLATILTFVPLAKLADRFNRKPFVLLIFAFFALFPLALVRASNLVLQTFALVIAGLRKIGEPARKALIVDLAPATARGRAVGIYYLIRGLIVFAASLVGGWLWLVNPQTPFYIAFLVGVAGLPAYSVWGPREASPLVVQQ